MMEFPPRRRRRPARAFGCAAAAVALFVARAGAAESPSPLISGATTQAAPAEPGREALKALESRDNSRALQLAEPAARQGDILAQYAIARIYDEGLGVEKSSQTAAAWYAYVLAQSSAAAARGGASAQFVLGKLHSLGKGAARDGARAVIWFSSAAAQGEPFAEEALAEAYGSGEGVGKDDARAAAWFRKAADQGLMRAEAALGEAYALGRGVDRDAARAAGWFRKAAEQGDAKSQAQLGMAYHNGAGVAKDDAEGAAWLRKSADQGYAQAQAYLADDYKYGLGVPRDYALAFHWFRLAAEQGNAAAQDDLGILYLFGLGTKQDSKEAAAWIEKSAEQGVAQAQFHLSILYLHGEGVDWSLLESARWFSKAVAQNGPAWVVRALFFELAACVLLLAGYFLLFKKPYALSVRARKIAGLAWLALFILAWVGASHDPFWGPFLLALGLCVFIPASLVGIWAARRRANGLKDLAAALEFAAVSESGFVPDPDLTEMPLLKRSRFFIINPANYYNIFSGVSDGWEALLFDLAFFRRRIIWWLRASTVRFRGQSVAAFRPPAAPPGFVLAPSADADLLFTKVEWPEVPLEGVLEGYRLKAQQPSGTLKLLTADVVGLLGAERTLAAESNGAWIAVYRSETEVEPAAALEFWRQARRLGGLLCANLHPPERGPASA